MLRNRYVIAGGIVLILIFANLINYYLWSWGLITVKVTDAPLNKVIKSIEWQGWVKIYSDLPAETTVSMYVDHVPLAEAMETLALNCNVPSSDVPDASANGDNAGQRRRGGGGGRVRWKLGFFVATNSSQLKYEVHAFQTGTLGDESMIYSYMTPLRMLASDSEMPVADPRLQVWPGIPATSPPPVARPTSSTDGIDPNAPASAVPPEEEAPHSVQGYLKAFAQQADIWILAPSTWDPAVATAPPPSGSIIGALKSFVRRMNGTSLQAVILTNRDERRTPGGGTGRAGTDWTITEERTRNAINGLPAEVRPDALAQLDQEIKFRQQVEATPPEQRRDLMRQHMLERISAGNDGWRRSPAQRAKMYQRMVNNRLIAQGKK